MSAYIVSNATIDVLVNAAEHGVSDRGMHWYHRPTETSYAIGGSFNATMRTPGDVGAMLWAENRRSVDYRYNEEEIEPVYEHRLLLGSLSPADVLSAITCYRYQSCEHEDWRDSEAAAFCDALEAKMVRRLTTDCPWDWTDSDLTARGLIGRNVRRLA